MNLKDFLGANYNWVVDEIKNDGINSDFPVFLPSDLNNVNFHPTINGNHLELHIAYYYHDCEDWLTSVNEQIRSHFNLWGDNTHERGLDIIPCISKYKCPEFGPPTPSKNIAALRYKLSSTEMMQLGLIKI